MNMPVFALLLRALAERLRAARGAYIPARRPRYTRHKTSTSIYYNCRLKPALRPAAIEFLDNILDTQAQGNGCTPVRGSAGSGKTAKHATLG